MDSGPVVAMCWEGEGVVKTGRVMLGETNPKDSKPGTIRGDYCIQVRNSRSNAGRGDIAFSMDSTFILIQSSLMLMKCFFRLVKRGMFTQDCSPAISAN